MASLEFEDVEAVVLELVVGLLLPLLEVASLSVDVAELEVVRCRCWDSFSTVSWLSSAVSTSCVSWGVAGSSQFAASTTASRQSTTSSSSSSSWRIQRTAIKGSKLLRWLPLHVLHDPSPSWLAWRRTELAVVVAEGCLLAPGGHSVLGCLQFFFEVEDPRFVRGCCGIQRFVLQLEPQACRSCRGEAFFCFFAAFAQTVQIFVAVADSVKATGAAFVSWQSQAGKAGKELSGGKAAHRRRERMQGADPSMAHAPKQWVCCGERCQGLCMAPRPGAPFACGGRQLRSS